MTETVTTTRNLSALDAANASDWARSEARDSLQLWDLYGQLRDILDAVPNHGHEGLSRAYQWDVERACNTQEQEARGFNRLTDATKLKDVRYRWIQVYPVTGGSEGHYIHVDLFWQRDYHEGRVPLFLLKTFGGHAEAVMLAGLLARVLGV